MGSHFMTLVFFFSTKQCVLYTSRSIMVRETLTVTKFFLCYSAGRAVFIAPPWRPLICEETWRLGQWTFRGEKPSIPPWKILIALSNRSIRRVNLTRHKWNNPHSITQFKIVLRFTDIVSKLECLFYRRRSRPFLIKAFCSVWLAGGSVV